MIQTITVTNLGGPIQISTDANSYNQSLTTLSNGNVVAAWYPNDGRYDVRLEILDANGNVVVPAFSAESNPDIGNSTVSVTPFANGDFALNYIAQIPNAPPSVSYEYKVQLFDSSGARIGSPIAAPPAGPNEPMGIAALAGGGYVTAIDYSKYFVGPPSETFPVEIQRYDSSGNPVGGAVDIGAQDPNIDNSFPQIAALSNGGYAVSWDSFGPTPTRFELHTQAFNADGTAAGADTIVATDNTWSGPTGSFRGNQSVVALSNGQYALVWGTVGSNGSSTSGGSVIEGEIFNGDGTAASGVFTVSASVPAGQGAGDPNATALANGEFLVTWSQGGGVGADGVHAQAFNSSGQAISAEDIVAPSAAADLRYPQATTLPDGDVMVTYSVTNAVFGQVIGTYDDVFTGAVDQTWENGANWSTGSAPSAGQFVDIPESAGSVVLSTDLSATALGGLTIGSTGGNANLTVTGAGDLDVAGQIAVLGNLTLTGGTVTADTIDLAGSIAGVGTLNLTGTGIAGATVSSSGLTSAGLITAGTKTTGGTLDIKGSANGVWLQVGEYFSDEMVIEGAVTANRVIFAQTALPETLDITATGSLALPSDNLPVITGATLQVDGTFTAANISLAGGSIVGGGTFDIAGGIGGYGTLSIEVQGVDSGGIFASGGTLFVTGPIDQPGSAATRLEISDWSVLEFESLVGTAAINPTVHFDGPHGLLKDIAAAGSEHFGTIFGFGGSEEIDLTAFGAGDTYSVAGQTLTITSADHSQSQSLAFAPNTALANIQMFDVGGFDQITIETVSTAYNGDGSYVATTSGVAGKPYTSFMIDYDASGKRTSESWSNASGLYLTETWNADGSVHDVHHYQVTGQSYADYDDVFANGKVVTETRSNGLVESWTYNADGSWSLQQSGISGSAYTGVEIDYDSAGVKLSQTWSGFSSGPYASMKVDYAASGQRTSEVWRNGAGVYLSETWNADGSVHDVHHYQVAGQSYTDYDVVYGANGKVASETRSNGLVESWSYNADGSYRLAVTGVADSAYTGFAIQYDAFGARTSETWTGFAGEPYTAMTVDYDASGRLLDQTWSGFTGEPYTSETIDYDTSGRRTGESWSTGDSQAWSYKADGSYVTTEYAAPGAGFVDYARAYSPGGLLASQLDYASGAGVLQLDAGGLAVTLSGANEAVITGGDLFLMPTNHSSETVNATGQSNETLTLQPGAGAVTLQGFAASDTLQFSNTVFADFGALMNAAQQVGANTVITETATDSLTLVNYARANLVAGQVAFV